ncbi:hypothetical protein VW29_17815 [Devosia limi DSM 17137]|uniref:Ribbon-helix-helix domain-containing protein n=1 Tax=Devosia limi DSM 17137 TaxID=1121477 RepID=A0A0F5LAJ6_9HYPH|nr:hypothetical protein [Devosia limi]KKB79416.1 hypothetical protein VW29_17815 [Devosia limi DSM 17137]SHF32380.1 hypothetical protein SAMN02745223_02352 [Devosia limi DSM 17137]
MDSPTTPTGRVTAIAADLAEPAEKLSQICYRLSRAKRNHLHRFALDRNTSLQTVIDEAIDDFLAKHQVEI